MTKYSWGKQTKDELPRHTFVLLNEIWDEIKVRQYNMATSIEIPRRLPLLLVADNVLLPGSSMRIPVRTMRKYELCFCSIV